MAPRRHDAVRRWQERFGAGMKLFRAGMMRFGSGTSGPALAGAVQNRRDGNESRAPGADVIAMPVGCGGSLRMQNPSIRGKKEGGFRNPLIIK